MTRHKIPLPIPYHTLRHTLKTLIWSIMWKYTHYCRKNPKMKINSFQKQTHGYLFIFDQTKLLRITRSMPIYRWRFTYSLFKLKDSIIQFVGNHTPRTNAEWEAFGFFYLKSNVFSSIPQQAFNLQICLFFTFSFKM